MNSNKPRGNTTSRSPTQMESTQLEKTFYRKTVYKRSKRYLDINKLNQQEHSLEVRRRKPNLNGIRTLEARVNTSFLNEEDVRQGRVQMGITSRKTKYQQTYSSLDRRTSSSSLHKSKGPCMTKMLPRQYFYAKDSKFTFPGKDQFNYFTSSKKDTSPDFTKILPRGYFKPKHHEKYLDTIDKDKASKAATHKFNNSAYNCLINLQKSARKNSKPKTLNEPLEVSVNRLLKAHESSKINTSANQHEFYQTTSKNVPSPFIRKTTKVNQYHFRAEEKQDILDLKRKEKMIRKRLQEINGKRKVKDNRPEMCDEKYFRRLKLKELKLQNTK